MDILQSITRLPDSKPLVRMVPISNSISTNVPVESLNFDGNSINIQSRIDAVNVKNTIPKVNREGLITGLIVASVIVVTLIIFINQFKNTKNEANKNT